MNGEPAAELERAALRDQRRADYARGQRAAASRALDRLILGVYGEGVRVVRDASPLRDFTPSQLDSVWELVRGEQGLHHNRHYDVPADGDAGCGRRECPR